MTTKPGAEDSLQPKISPIPPHQCISVVCDFSRISGDLGSFLLLAKTMNCFWLQEGKLKVTQTFNSSLPTECFFLLIKFDITKPRPKKSSSTTVCFSFKSSWFLVGRYAIAALMMLWMCKFVISWSPQSYCRLSCKGTTTRYTMPTCQSVLSLWLCK